MKLQILCPNDKCKSKDTLSFKFENPNGDRYICRACRTEFLCSLDIKIVRQGLIPEERNKIIHEIQEKMGVHG